MFTIDANVWVASLDPSDRFHEQSTAFLLAAASRRLRAVAPSFLLVEVACATARRDSGREEGQVGGRQVIELLLTHPSLRLIPMDDTLLLRAADLGTARKLRGADALYAAIAESTGTLLITWDRELQQRADGISPASWLAERV